MLLLLMTRAGCMAGAGTRHAPLSSSLLLFPVFFLFWRPPPSPLSFLCPFPSFLLPFCLLPFLSSSFLFCFLNHASLSFNVRARRSLLCLLLLLLLVVKNEADCMAGAKAQVYTSCNCILVSAVWPSGHRQHSGLSSHATTHCSTAK